MFKSLQLEAAVLLLPSLFKEDPGLLFEVEVSHEQLTTVCETQSNQSTTLIAHFVIQMISMQTLFFLFVGLHKLCYQIEEKSVHFQFMAKSI